jgi:hypothetical protein
VGLSRGKCIPKGDVMFIGKVQRSADVACSRENLVEGLSLEILLTLKAEKSLIFLVGTRRPAVSIIE